MSRLQGKRGCSGRGFWGTAHSTLLHARISSWNLVFALVFLVSLLSISLESESSCYLILEAQVKSASFDWRYDVTAIGRLETQVLSASFEQW